jgi:hypothetical protein
MDTSRISFVREEDTLKIPVPYSLSKDTTRLRRYFMNVDWESQTRYFLDIFPGAFTDIYGLSHDTILLNFMTHDVEYYGRILLNLKGVDGQKIIQVLDKNAEIVRMATLQEDGQIVFDYMEPAAFTLKVVHDFNGNGEWDTGNYLEGIQPEKVMYHPGTLTLRSNFDLELNWDLKEGEQQPSEGE